jgi:hypothetical protein
MVKHIHIDDDSVYLNVKSKKIIPMITLDFMQQERLGQIEGLLYGELDAGLQGDEDYDDEEGEDGEWVTVETKETLQNVKQYYYQEQQLLQQQQNGNSICFNGVNNGLNQFNTTTSWPENSNFTFSLPNNC